MTNSGRGVAYAFWQRVQNERLRQGLTALELAKRSGVGRNTIDRLENGKRKPLVTTVHKLADALHIDRQEALRDAGLSIDHLVITDPAQDHVGIDEVRRAILEASAYTEDQRRALLAQLDGFDLENQRKPPIMGDLHKIDGEIVNRLDTDEVREARDTSRSGRE
ncbi:helix-turn-helix domain-containing protein [Actinoplanes sp. CA-054009]